MGSDNYRYSTLIASQRWKLWVLGPIAVCAGLLLLWNRQLAFYVDADPFLVSLGGAVLGLTTLVAGCLTLRYPSCRLSLLWYGVSKKSVGSWLEWVLDIQKCPRCGFEDSTAQQHQSN